MDWTGGTRRTPSATLACATTWTWWGQCPPFDGVARQESVQHTLVDRMRRIRDEVSPGTPFVVAADPGRAQGPVRA